jgi:hypothetical protein
MNADETFFFSLNFDDKIINSLPFFLGKDKKETGLISSEEGGGGGGGVGVLFVILLVN